jgi:hypothetical protein
MARFRSDAAWRHFVAWCRARRLKPLPAHPWTIAAYARACERRFGHRAVVARVGSIVRAHLMQGHAAADRHPTVARTLIAIAQQAENRPVAADLFDPADFVAPDEKPKLERKPKLEKKKAKGREAKRGLRGTPRLVRRPAPFGDAGAARNPQAAGPDE